MGFLKELFDKKLKNGMKHSDHDEGLDLTGRFQSEYFPPALRKQSLKENATDEVNNKLDSFNNENAVCFVRQEAKSFSFPNRTSTSRKRLDEIPPEPLEPPSYTSVTQFSQKVELYRGSVATVYKGLCIESNIKVIIKAYHKHKMHLKHHHKLKREILAMKALSGPLVAQIYSTFEDANNIYIIMEYCEGGDLFKTMLMQGGVLEEQWVCVEIIAPLLRILEKMHSLKLLHRDIKPENVFLTGLGKFKLGDFGLAIKFDEEIPFSRSGTLDYMAPEVLKNPSVPFQEGRNVDLATLTSRGVKPYGTGVDVWAAGVLAYELCCGRPPFEVEDETQTAALIMYSDNIRFPMNKSSQWADFVRQALIKNPDQRATAAQLLNHPWICSNLERICADSYRPSKEMLLRPLPLLEITSFLEVAGPREMQRSVSMTQAHIPAMRSAQSFSSGGPNPAERLREIHQAMELEKIQNHEREHASSSSPPLEPLTPPKSPRSPSHSGGGHHNAVSPLAKKAALHSIKIALPELEDFPPIPLDGSTSPSTPIIKPGIKERMKFYFQRQAGGVGGL